jgi:hypothetical protein
MATGDINSVGARVAWLIGARDTAFTFTINDDRFKMAEIANAIIETESELVQDFADAYHPQRHSLLAWLPKKGMVSGNNVPDHIGQIEAVRVSGTGLAFTRTSGNVLTSAAHGFITGSTVVRVSNVGGALPAGMFANTDYPVIVLSATTFSVATSVTNALAGTAAVLTGAGTGVHTVTPWVMGEATTRNNIRSWRENPTIFENTEGYFNNTNGMLEFLSPIAQVNIVSYDPYYNSLNTDTIDAYLQIDSKWEGLLAYGAVCKLGKIGIPGALVTHYGNKYEAGRQRLREGMNYRPQVAEAEAAA